MLFYQMAKKLMIIDFQILRTHQSLQAKLTNRYINRDVNVIA